jgi:peptidoglycan hydrolase-like protein with peptidoglycan-binding domain
MSIPKLNPGASGEMVLALQHALTANGYNVPATGKFDDATTAGLEAFQGDNSLPVQVYCDQATWVALYGAKG